MLNYGVICGETQKHGYKLIIVDNDSKFHCKALVQAAEAEGIQIYPGSGKRVWVTQ